MRIELAKNVASITLEILAKVFNKFSDEWKIADIYSLHKKRSKPEYNNNRGVSVTSSLARFKRTKCI